MRPDAGRSIKGQNGSGPTPDLQGWLRSTGTQRAAQDSCHIYFFPELWPHALLSARRKAVGTALSYLSRHFYALCPGAWAVAS